MKPLASRFAFLGRITCLALIVGCCSAAPAGASLYISSPETTTILRANLNGSGLTTLFSGSPFGSGGDGVAVGAGHIYWSWQEGIGRANLDGSSPNKNFITGIEGISGVTVSGTHIYWTQGENVGRANVTGKEVEPTFITGAPGKTLDGVAVEGEYIYWTNFWSSALGRAKLDGSEVQQEWVIGTHTPMGLVANSQYLYWAITYENHIGRARLDGTELTTNFITTGLSSNGNEGVQLALYGQHIYWANPTTGTIGRANINGTEIEPSFITGAGNPLGVSTEPPIVTTQPATEVTSSSATLNATVNPEGVEMSKCVLEYGESTAYGSSKACSPSPGSGESAVAVSASVTGLKPNTVYHYRVAAENAEGFFTGGDETVTTLESSKTEETTKPAVPAKASDKGVTAEASGGVGSITVGHYSSANIGGPGLAGSSGAYVQVSHSTGATFTKIEYKDCELGGAKTLWWDNPATGWEPILEPVAVYDEATKCITVTATASTRPSVAQLADPRHVGGPSANEEYVNCEPAKHGKYSDSSCQSEDVVKGKGKGGFEWYPAPACYPMKGGKYSDGSCSSLKIKKGHPKGKDEKANDSFKVSSGSTVIKVLGQPSVECSSSESSLGLMRGPNEAAVELALRDCKRQSVNCESATVAGLITSQPLESYSYEEENEKKELEYFSVLAAHGHSMMSFKCGSTEFSLLGAAAGQLKATLNAPITSTEATFSESAGPQELELEETKTQTRHEAWLTTKTTTTTEQPIEIKVKG
jgi:hypothetical protein